ncbi:class I SAM-dependent methyltransferase [Enterococcus sp. BWM-S5]|uniref:Class I SAM-dependent methyltransferase n=1 Tax=Enterococcus larvae TaxID=2794352 RepID=A0ABS4CIU9_9ENTE|nr:class I SAM-dependent methyltransferase [Enterococcus larvae]MBP1045862.1 class I SAM-dependent methyltransferase [Enterococcus larvae]
MILFAAVLLVITFLFFYLMKQSKKPTGIVGRGMMKIWNRVYLPMARWSLTVFTERKAERILDIGVGNGASTLLLKEYFPDAQIVGIDISDAAIQAANDRAVVGVQFFVRSIEETQLKKESYDLVTAYQTHFHWEDLDKAFVEIYRVLKSDGILLIACEQAKLHYYLKDIAKTTVFADYMARWGFELENTAESSGWITYLLRKK